MKRREYLKTFIGVPLCLVMSVFDLISSTRSYNVVEAFAYKVFGTISFQDEGVFLLTMQNLLFVVVCNILFADSLSAHFRTGCVYVFSRIHNRSRWFFKQVISLMAKTSIFTCLYLLTTLLICACKSNETVQIKDLYSLVLIFVFSLLLCGLTTLSVNLLSIRWGTTVGFIFVQLSLFSLIFVGTITYKSPVAIALNPVSCLNVLGHEHEVLLNLLCSFGWMLLLCFVGRNFIKKYDVYLFDAEVT